MREAAEVPRLRLGLRRVPGSVAYPAGLLATSVGLRVSGCSNDDDDDDNNDGGGGGDDDGDGWSASDSE